MEHILSLSYGKDSLACLGAIEKLGWPLFKDHSLEIVELLKGVTVPDVGKVKIPNIWG